MGRKICSWDVGIKHLAFCIIDVNESNFKIEKWENIDLTDGNQKRCCAILKKKKGDNNEKICNAKPKYIYENNNEIKYYCGSHYSNYKVKPEEIEIKYSEVYNNLNKDKCEYILKSDNKCGKKGLFKFQDTVCCKTHKETLLKKKIKELDIKSIKNKKCTSLDPQELCQKMYEKLSNIEDFKNVDEVYIENQPGLTNPPMKAVSSMLFSYFVYLFSINNFKNKTVKYVSPYYKIEVDESLIKFIENKINEHNLIKKDNCKCRLCKLNNEIIENKKKFNNEFSKYGFSYECTKELGILYTEKILIDNNIQNQFDLIKNYKKKDDYCDAFLHGYKKIK